MSNSKNLLISFLGGALAGGAIAYYSQTKQGKDLTKKVKKKAKKAYNNSVDALQDQKQAIEDSFNEAMESIDVKTLEKKGKEAIDAFKEKLNKA